MCVKRTLERPWLLLGGLLVDPEQQLWNILKYFFYMILEYIKFTFFLWYIIIVVEGDGSCKLKEYVDLRLWLGLSSLMIGDNSGLDVDSSVLEEL